MARVELRVPAAHGRALRVKAGEIIRITDIEGDQAADIFVFMDGYPAECISTSCTRWQGSEFVSQGSLGSGKEGAAGGHIRLQEGTILLSNLRRPLLTFLHDAAEGLHDMLLPACSRERYQHWGFEGHRNCRENCMEAAREFFELPYEHVPDPVNFFTKILVQSDVMRLYDAKTKPGAYVELRAELDLIVAVSSCPFDLNSWMNGGRVTDLLVTIRSN